MSDGSGGYSRGSAGLAEGLATVTGAAAALLARVADWTPLPLMGAGNVNGQGGSNDDPAETLAALMPESLLFSGLLDLPLATMSRSATTGAKTSTKTRWGGDKTNQQHPCPASAVA